MGIANVAPCREKGAPDGAGAAVALDCGAAVGVPAVAGDGAGVVVGAAALGGETSEDVQPATTNRESAIAATARRTGSR
jgi:hypothetical protein